MHALGAGMLFIKKKIDKYIDNSHEDFATWALSDVGSLPKSFPKLL